MAKVFVILLTFIYAFSATGATVHLHYCCGELQKLVTPHAPEKPAPEDCPLCVTHQEKKEKDSNCCIDDSSTGCEVDQSGHGHCQDVKVEPKKTTEELLPTADKRLAKIYPVELFAFTLANIGGLPPDLCLAVQTIDDAPPDVAVPLFIQHCTYRI